MLKNIEGIVIKSINYSETHKIITIFTQHAGIISGISRGANKPKSRLSAVSQVFIHGNFQVFVTKGLSTVQQGEILHSFRKIREDIVKTAYAAYVVELTSKILEERTPEGFMYDQLLGTLQWINDREDYFIPVMMYELKMYEKGGFAPILNHCVNCGQTAFPYAFSVQEGGLVCQQCLHHDGSEFPLPNPIAKLLPILASVSLKQIGSISIKPENQQMLRKLLNHYYDQYGGYSLKSRKFLDQLDQWEA